MIVVADHAPVKSMKRHSPFNTPPTYSTRSLVRFVVSCLAIVIASSCATHNCDNGPSNGNGERNLPGWGRAVDPDGDCQFFIDRGTLLINVPGSAYPHDLAAEINRTNAPRVLQQVNGDFTVQVRVDGRFSPGTESTQANRLAYNGAGLVAMADPQNVVTLARAVIQKPGEGPAPYANFEIRGNGHLLRIGLTDDHPLPITGPVFLRLQRRGSEMIGEASLDGIHWDTLGSKDLPTHWPKALHIGVVAISTSTEEFDPRFSKFRIVK
jgi:regulation of enolase protein 1 (concanavalin A-like superfamily)